jgi:hypothetical protein
LSSSNRHHALRGLALLHGEGLEQIGGGERRLARDRLFQETAASRSLPALSWVEGGA